jgi:hypothetical protein
VSDQLASTISLATELGGLVVMMFGADGFDVFDLLAFVD